MSFTGGKRQHQRNIEIFATIFFVFIFIAMETRKVHANFVSKYSIKQKIKSNSEKTDPFLLLTQILMKFQWLRHT